MTTATTTIPAAVSVSMAPPRRLMQDHRFRSFKTRDDRTLWDGLLAPVEALIEDGYQVVRVLIDWGAREPLLPRERERAARTLTRCDVGVCAYQEQTCGYGRGRTEFWLERG